GVGRRELADAVGDLQDDRNRSECLSEPSRAGRLLADAAAGKRDRLVGESRLLASDTELDQDERRAAQRRVEVVGDRELAVVAGRAEHAIGETAYNLAALGIDVLQNELTQIQPLPLACEPGHEFRRVGGAAAYDGELHTVFCVIILLEILTK